LDLDEARLKKFHLFCIFSFNFNMALRLATILRPSRLAFAVRCMTTGESGSGAGKGGGSGGAVRDAGGAFGQREAALEEQYFRKLTQTQLTDLKSSFVEEIKYHKHEIEELEATIARHKRKLAHLKQIAEHKD